MVREVVLAARRVFVYSPVVEFSKAEGELLERGTLVVDNRYTYFNINLGGIFYICFSNILGVDCLLYKLCLRCEGNVTKIKKYIMK